MAEANPLTASDPLTAQRVAGSAANHPDGFSGKIKAFLTQPAVQRALPMIVTAGGLAMAGALYLALADGPQRVLYSSLSDGERASIVETLDQGGISYQIDNATGMVTVGEDDLYRARMLVASDGSLATPETSTQILDSIPMGASRTLEGERLRNARERELMFTIAEIDGVESVRVHLATPERSAFVRESVPPSASVMVKLARGRSLSEAQVSAIINLVAGSVPGLTADAVRVVDQQGRLLSDKPDGDMELLQLQSEYESKLRAQIAKLLVPMLGEGNFSSEVQVELDMTEVTSARESYDKEGAVRSEREMRSTRSGAGAAGGVPGVLSNTPPPPTEVEEAAPEGTPAPEAGGETTGESSAQRTYELGREVAVTSSRPGAVSRLTVAVALSEEALKKIAPATAEQVQELVSSAVGASADRGDQVTVIAGTFEEIVEEELPFYETAWFATILRNAVALIAVILGLLFGVRPIVKALKRGDENAEADADEASEEGIANASGNSLVIDGNTAPPSPEILQEQVDLARSLATQQPDRAVTALRRMLANPDPEHG